MFRLCSVGRFFRAILGPPGVLWLWGIKKSNNRRSAMRTALMTGIVVLGLGLCGSTARAAGPEDRLVAGWYEQYLGRSAYIDELPYWTDQMCRGASPDVIRAGILASEEYYCRRGEAPEGFVAGLYADVLGRTACEREIRYWVCRLSTCGCRKTLAKEFICAASRELAQPPAPYAPALRPGPETLRFPLRMER
jgi:hypothetical protein